MARKNNSSAKKVTVAASNEAPITSFDEAAALAALSGVDYAPIAATTWSEPEIETVAPMTEDEIAAATAAIETDEAIEAVLSEDTSDPSLPMGENGNSLVDDEEPAAPAETDEFMETMRSFDQVDVLAKANDIAREIDARAKFEFIKKPDVTTIQRTLKNARTALTTSMSPARVLLAANVSEAFINRVLHEGSKYNVYAIGKFADIAIALGDGVIKNAINNACMRSLFKCRAAGVTFTMEVAKACASNKIQIDPSIRKHLVRHTVSASTAPTQASSTMQALATLGIVTVSGSHKNPIFTLTDAPITKRLEKLLAA